MSGRADTMQVSGQKPPLVFATGAAEGVAAILEQTAGGLSLLTMEMTRDLGRELNELALTTATLASGQARSFTDAAANLGERHDQFTAQTLVALLVFDGLVSPVIRRLAYPRSAPTSVIALEAGAPGEASAVTGGASMQFLRACVRPGNHEVAAAFCSDAGLSIAADLHSIFSDNNVRRAISTLDVDDTIVADEQAVRQLKRIGAIDERIAYCEYSTVSTLPKATPEILERLREDALALAGALLRSAGGPQRLAENLQSAGSRALPGFAPEAALETALGVFHHSIAHQWYELGTWIRPPQYRLLDAERRAVKSLIIWTDRT